MADRTVFTGASVSTLCSIRTRRTACASSTPFARRIAIAASTTLAAITATGATTSASTTVSGQLAEP
ncbi:hypothetical protein KDX38_23705 [Pseudomonas sp. CDFA 602]|uniref:hypothetical protein n=1 Tax=Pseudomonas californiensis TaxID=2829823 RepID=UPI001E45DAAA|nr:hypothetical protein [Pseudomonas californiensis]MCD5996627.1 hypothetical protein [Pseudomonas californiensis]MCD6002196.1 hypothetical protein [Pseudomonas californiensis]